jgi:acyl-CoA synthetase (NDP forming)
VSELQLGNLLAPRSLAVVGASDKGNVGGRVFRNALAMGFSGPVYPVNPNYESVGGQTCHASVSRLPETPDCVVVAVPASAALDVLRDAADAGVRSAVLLAEGFADAGTDEGLRRNEQLLALARDSGMAISGPNSMGIVSLRRHFASAFVNLPKGLREGGLSLVSQSGGLMNAMLELGRNRALGFNYLVSAGNGAIVGLPDYLDWLADDDDTSVIACVVEGVRNGARFYEALRRACRRKPVVVLKLGRTEEGQKGTLTHTGSLAGSDLVFHGACRQAGAAMVTDVDSLIETASLFLSAPLPKGDNVAIFSVSGGATVLTADLGVKAGLRFRPLASATNARLQEILEVDHPFNNPMDVVGNPRLVKGDNLRLCLEVMNADQSIDVIAFVLAMQRDPAASHEKLMGAIKDFVPQLRKPLIVMSEMTWHWRESPPDVGAPVTSTLAEGLLAIRQLVDYSAWRRRTVSRSEPQQAAALPDHRGTLAEYESKAVLAKAGFRVPAALLARDAEAAAVFARSLGRPVAMKLQARRLVHKTEIGGVEVGLLWEADIRATFDRLMAAGRGADPSAEIDGILVEEMAGKGPEFILGLHCDPQFGPVVMLGVGGTFAELVADSALRLPPLGRTEAADMLDELKFGRKLLSGFRDLPKADDAALLDAVVRLSDFVVANADRLEGIDVNPVRLVGGEAVVLDATLVLR